MSQRLVRKVVVCSAALRDEGTSHDYAPTAPRATRSRACVPATGCTPRCRGRSHMDHRRSLPRDHRGDRALPEAKASSPSTWKRLRSSPSPYARPSSRLRLLHFRHASRRRVGARLLGCRRRRSAVVAVRGRRVGPHHRLVTINRVPPRCRWREVREVAFKPPPGARVSANVGESFDVTSFYPADGSRACRRPGVGGHPRTGSRAARSVAPRRS